MVLDLAQSRTGTARGQHPELPQRTDTSNKGLQDGQGDYSGDCKVLGGENKSKTLRRDPDDLVTPEEAPGGEAQQPRGTRGLTATRGKERGRERRPARPAAGSSARVI